MKSIVNIAGYKFIKLTALPERRDALLEKAANLQLKGTILLSVEGINIMLAGTVEAIQNFTQFLREDSCFSDMTFRQSYSDFQPFKQLKVKIKKEIITLGQPDVHPEIKSAPHVSPEEFKKWLDEKRDLTILDTRNHYEVTIGTFENAQHLNIEDFSEFPKASEQVSRDKPIVMFCTGGIRCEKAAIVLQNAGYKNVYQLEGGILNYFAKVGGEYYQGDCFVFDDRIKLQPTNLRK